jgi:predicted enzyme related to lactoylglutathione lyase
MDHIIVHFDIPATDPEALARFYSQLFGWKIEKAPGAVPYWLIETAPEGRGVGGGIMPREAPEQHPNNYVLVESVAEFSNKVQELGGRIVVPKMAVPRMGYFAIAIDPQGNSFGLWEDDPSAA